MGGRHVLDLSYDGYIPIPDIDHCLALWYEIRDTSDQTKRWDRTCSTILRPVRCGSTNLSRLLCCAEAEIKSTAHELGRELERKLTSVNLRHHDPPSPSIQRRSDPFMTMPRHSNYRCTSSLAHETDGMDQLCQCLNVHRRVFRIEPYEVESKGSYGAYLLRAWQTVIVS